MSAFLSVIYLAVSLEQWTGFSFALADVAKDSSARSLMLESTGLTTAEETDKLLCVDVVRVMMFTKSVSCVRLTAPLYIGKILAEQGYSSTTKYLGRLFGMLKKMLSRCLILQEVRTRKRSASSRSEHRHCPRHKDPLPWKVFLPKSIM